jgi:hypothetical protein
MISVRHELNRIHGALTSDKPPERYDELYAAQQALVWASEPDVFKSPYDLIVQPTDIPEDSRDCPAGNDLSASLDSRDDHAERLSPRQISPVR